MTTTETPTFYTCRGCTEEFNEQEHPPIFDEGELRYAPRGYELNKYDKQECLDGASEAYWTSKWEAALS